MPSLPPIRPRCLNPQSPAGWCYFGRSWKFLEGGPVESHWRQAFEENTWLLAPGSWLLPGTHEVRQKTSITGSCCPISCLSTLLEVWNQVTRNGILWNLELRKHLFVFTLSMSGVWAQWRKSWYRRDWVSHDWTNERMRITRCVQISSKPVQR